MWWETALIHLVNAGSPCSAAFFLKSSRHWRFPVFSIAKLLLRYQNRRVMRIMKSPMAVRNPSTSGETEIQKLYWKLFVIFHLISSFHCRQDRQVQPSRRQYYSIWSPVWPALWLIIDWTLSKGEMAENIKYNKLPMLGLHIIFEKKM